MSEAKPKEFWITLTENDAFVSFAPNPYGIHVIEYSAYEKLYKERNELLLARVADAAEALVIGFGQEQAKVWKESIEAPLKKERDEYRATLDKVDEHTQIFSGVAGNQSLYEMIKDVLAKYTKEKS